MEEADNLLPHCLAHYRKCFHLFCFLYLSLFYEYIFYDTVQIWLCMALLSVFLSYLGISQNSQFKI